MYRSTAAEKVVLYGQPLRRLWLIGGIVLIIVIWVLCLIPNPPHLNIHNEDKFYHIITFGFALLWWAQIIKSLTSRALLALSLIAMGIAIEYVQGWTGWRDFDYADMLADGLGVLIGWCLAYTPLGATLAHLEKLNLCKSSQEPRIY